MASPEPGNPPFIPIADIEVDAVTPERSGFRLDGRGADGAEYRVDLHLDLPVDQRTQQVLAELLSQSELKIARRTASPPFEALKRERARQRAKSLRADGT
jgi:hypothetical protein